MNIFELPTPCYVIDEGKLENNLRLLSEVENRTGAKILLAQKCFSGFCEYPLIAKYISGTTASGLYDEWKRASSALESEIKDLKKQL